MARFTNKVCLICGAKGAANEIAKIVSSEGGTVVINDPDKALTDAISAPVADKMNLSTSGEDSKKLVAEVLAKHKAIHSVIVNFDEYDAAKTRSENITVEAYRKVMDGNVTPTFHILAAVREHFRAKQETGEQASVVILGSVAGLSGLSIGSLYAAAKAAQFGMVRGVAKEFGRFANVNGIAQGFYSEKVNRPGPKDKEKKDFLTMKTARADQDLTYVDVAKMAAYLASEDAKMISGQVIPVDGGLWLRVQA
ncbi:MAG: SDR family oxidoreductase [Candidatus Lokiarchaeota archaeon]|nr:SDR family oxidoreductase [Candidatus Lokiarchaeota archaeon]